MFLIGILVGLLLSAAFIYVSGALINVKRELEEEKKKKEEEASRLVCPDCGSEPMELIQEYTYEKPDREERVDGSVYHCCHCGHDEVIERRWGLISTIQRRYFHG